jgi:mono/diheme cytochrome c family protein
MSGTQGYLNGCALALAALIGVSVPVLAQDNSDLAVGKDVWNRASCFNCHGSAAQGGNGGDWPVGPSLRSTALDKETMAQIVSCGIPGTPMPAWLKGAYTKVECYGMPVGSRPAGMTVPAIFTDDEIKALVDYVFATFVQTPQP